MPREQLEFDLVSPDLAGLGLEELQLLREAAELHGQADEKTRLVKVAAEICRQDQILAPKQANELEELRVLIGPKSWNQKMRRSWQKRLKINLKGVRKVIIALRFLRNHEP
jgi:hypothetical protein